MADHKSVIGLHRVLDARGLERRNRSSFVIVYLLAVIVALVIALVIVTSTVPNCLKP